MKRLLIYLGLLATLLAMPYHAKAEQNWAYYLRGSFNNWADEPNSDYKFGDTSSSDGEITWSKSISGSTLLTNRVDNTAYFKVRIIYTGDSPSNYDLGATSGNNTVITLGSSCEINSDNKNNAIQINNVKADHNYMITFVSSSGRNSGKITVTDVGAITPTEEAITLRTDAYKRPNNDAWIGIKYNEYDSDNDTYIWYLNAIDFTSASRFKLELNNNWYGNGETVGSEFVTLGTGVNNCIPTIPTTTGNQVVRLEAKNVSGSWQARIVAGDGAHQYYWVSPQVTNNQKLPYFKLVPSRNRWRNGGDGKISSKYYTFTIQDEFIKQFNGSDMPKNIPKNTQIQWYIVRDDGKVFYRPTSELPVDDTPTSYGTDHGGSGTLDSHVRYKNYWGEGYGDYKTTDANRSGSFSFSKGSAKAYTFNLNAEKGHVFFNYTTASAATNIDYYLIGNFTSAKGEVDISIDDTHPMTKWYYKGDLVTQSPVADADSIVYKVNVTKPAEGWGDLYIDINPSGNTDWKDVIRPLINLGNNLDGRALHGGLVVNNSDQSLNPETSDDYIGYTFSFNATTFTYQLEFHTSLYLVGPGVSDSDKEGEEGSWDLSNVTSSDPRIRLKATQEKDHYRNLVYFTNGGQFRFIKNTDESATPNYKYTWHENGNKPLWKNAKGNAEAYYPGSETQFRNYIQYENDGSSNSKEPKDAETNSMTFDLPTGWYYVNFYPNAGTPYYTIEHSMELRDFNEVYYRSAAVPAGEVRNVQGRNDYNFLRVWSDHIAWNKPDNIDVFVVSEFGHDASSHTTTATLTKLDVNYIPAKTGVILGCKLSKDNLTSGLVYDNAATLAWDNGENVNYYNTLTAELTPYSAPSTSYSGDSKLIPLYSAESLKRFSDDTGIGTGDGYANYLFGFYRCKKYQKNYTGYDNDFDMGFWLTTGIGQTYANSAFLHLTKEEAEDLGVGTAYPTANDTSGSRASAPAFMLLFDESDDNVITGISDITTAKGNSVASQGWYTLQGVRTPKPTQRGIYIYNGKKVIVND